LRILVTSGRPIEGQTSFLMDFSRSMSFGSIRRSLSSLSSLKQFDSAASLLPSPLSSASCPSFIDTAASMPNVSVNHLYQFPNLPPHRFDNPREDPRFDLLQSSQQCASFPPIIWKLHDIGSSMLAIGVSFPSHWIEIPVKLLCATICAESLHNWT